ncbi:MAG: hypothetical protein FLDDKLPJ_03669 [Phycisphaerae bacterium]|nr:hypothetical protein [Phycisphaerae bacterium]
MARQRPGLPDDFTLDVAPEAPVQLDDYLDRELPATKPTQSATATPPPAQAAKKSEPREERKRDEKVLKLPREKPRTAAASQTRPGRVRESRRPPRKELSLDAETQRKADDVVDDIREQGPQPDATASEFIRGLVQLAHDVRHKADYSALNRRGQWGSATARAFVADLKEAFLRAIGEYFIDRYPLEARKRMEEAQVEGRGQESR